MPEANVGLLLGTPAGHDTQIVGLDIDVTDDDELALLQSVLPRSSMSKRGSKGVTLLYRASASLKSRSYDRAATETTSAERLVDLLAAGRHTCVPPSRHPAGVDYQWLTGPVPADELPLLTEDDLEKLEDTLETLGWVRDGRAASGPTGERAPMAPFDPSDPWSVAKAVALSNLDAWFSDLDLPGTRRARGGWEAIPTWRASSSGRPTEMRKRNLSASSTGIRDWGAAGADAGLTAIDVVQRALDLSASESLIWLQEKLGIQDNDSDVVIDLASRRPADDESDLPAPLRGLGPTLNATTPPPSGENDGVAAGVLGARTIDYISSTSPTHERPRNSVGRVLDLNAWRSSRLVGEPPEVQWLVRDAVPLAVPGMVAAQGDAGKSFLLLDLARRIAFNASPLEGPAFGGMVEREGTCVIITAEDDAAAVHRRIASIDQKNARFSRNGERLIVVPLPDAGGPLPLVALNRKGQLEATEGYRRIADQLAAIDDLQLVVFDPLAAFVHAPINEDPAAGQFTCSLMAMLAAETQATVLLSHHMRKGDRKTPVSTPQEAREMVRGTTALVDGLRWVYALWPEIDSEARKVCERLKIQYQGNSVINGAVVKSNGPAQRRISTYVRSESGLLIDQTAMLREPPSERQEQMAALAFAIGEAARAGAPFTRTGASGLKEQSYRLPAAFRDMGRPRLLRLCEDALERQIIVSALAKGSTTTKWLDVPGGPFALGVGEFALGQAPVSDAAA